MKYSFTKMLPALFLLAGLSGCIKEDRSECNPGALLKYDYSLNTEHANLFGEEVGKVTVYVFDEQGMYYGTYSDAGSHLTNSWQMLLPLPAGNYTAVTWGGLLDSYRLGETDTDETAFHSGLKKGVTHIDNFMLSAEEEGLTLQKLDSLYHGKADVTSVFLPETATTVELTKNTNLLIVTIEDESIRETASKGGELPYEIYCKGANGRYRADNRLGKKCASLTYQPHKAHTATGKMEVEIDLLRLMAGQPLRLVIKDRAGKSVYDIDLIENLRATGQYVTQEELDREDVYHVVLRRGTGGEGEDGAIGITINGWVPVDIKPEL
ncbi:FimB/Mfa2 family fimbrial subunit [Bacteroides muris (ex Fokt et al. 2023)]|uniref:FimB/Mfa2 family fimbrial subunit n=1 Tax=Bacteroides muris (ex Fokt et al. 2023) TaxID=2937417 RepID=A0A9X2NPH0_9BACE|nr:FimB/Mfa2 family fimbrial subunit [Bacteroides muris (ex Fokt et al. 2023)]MCR6503886.1 FimB/Mfa2 family fimbrial subunit [Bacteroides muris (ex Fokt et al. 2023)]